VASVQTFAAPLERQRYWQDQDGALSTSKRKDDAIQLVWNFTDKLGGATISSVAYADSGLTTSAKSNTTTAVTFTYTGIGETKLTITLSSSLKLIATLRAYDTEGVRQKDYR